jgi:hypothetical protein
MDAFLADTDIHYSEIATVLLAATSDAAMARADKIIRASGLPVGAKLQIDAARERLGQQASATALWLELDRDGGEPMRELLRSVSTDVSDGRYAAVVSIPASLIDHVYSQVTNDDVELVVDGTDAERTAALAVARAWQSRLTQLSDVSSDRNAERLRQLSDEVSRIASTLARLSSHSLATPAAAETSLSTHTLDANTVRKVIHARRLRTRYFPEELFADPAWDMMLDLLQAEIAQLRVPVSSLCIAAAVPATTALRWLKAMVGQGLFIRRADPHDGRRVFVELAPDTSRALRRYFTEIAEVAVV